MRIRTVLPIVPLLLGIPSLAQANPVLGLSQSGAAKGDVTAGVDAGTIVDQAFEFLGEGRFSEAAAVLKRAGDDATARYLLGAIHEYGSLGKRNDRAARKHYEVAVLGHCPDAAQALVRLARRGGGASSAAVQHWLYEAFKLGDDGAALDISREHARSGRAGDASQALAWARVAKAADVVGAGALEADLEKRFPDAARGAAVRQKLIERKLERDRDSIDGVVQVQVSPEIFLPKGAERGKQGPSEESSEESSDGPVVETVAESSAESVVETPVVAEEVVPAEVVTPAQPTKALSPLDAANALYAAEDYRAALRAYQPLAEAGDGAAAFYVGRIHEMGYVGPRNAIEAERWYLRASQAGIGTAMENLGLMVLQGRGLEKNPAEATDFLTLAAYAGSLGGATNVGFAYLTGQGREKDLVEGWAWTAIAADLGQDNASSNLGVGERKMTSPQKEQARRRKERLAAELRGDEKPARALPALPVAQRSRGRQEARKPRQAQQPQGTQRPQASGAGASQRRGLGRARTGSTPQAAAPAPKPAATKGSIRMTQAGLQDELMGSMKSHTMLLPEGWDLKGGVTWNPLSTWAYVSVDARAGGPEGQHVQFLPNGSFTYYGGTQVPGSPKPPQLGEMTGGKMFLPPGEGPADFVSRTLFPAYHPKATDFEVVSVGEVEAVAAQYRELFAPIIEQTKAMNQSGAMSSGMSSSVSVGCPVVRVRYSEGGQAFEEQFTFMYYRMDFGGEMGMGMSMNVSDWSVNDVRGLRAPAGQLDASLPMLHTVSTSLKPTREWQAIVDEISKQVIRNQQEVSRMQHQTSMQNLAALRKRGETMRQANAEIMESNQASWERNQASQDRVSRAWSNTMLGVDDYKLPDGSVRSLDSSYRHVYTSGGDSFLFTDDANLDPNIGSTLEWQRVAPVQPLRDTAPR